MKLTIDGKSYDVELQPEAVVVNGTAYKTFALRDNGETTVRVAGRPYKVVFKDEKTAVVDGRQFTVEVSGRARIGAKPKKAEAKGPVKSHARGAVKALMPGKVLSIRVKEGDAVTAGTVLLILEAMKMENEIKAPQDGVVKTIAVAPGQTVNNGDVLVVVE